jgi:aromatic-amino-acid transaminase
MQLIPSHQSRPSDDPIFAAHQEATRRKARGESIVDATIGVLLAEDGSLAVLPSAARAVHEVPSIEWATYAPIAGTPEFRRAVIDDLLGAVPDLRESAVAVATPGGSGALRHAITNFLEPGQAALTTNWYWSPYRTLCDESDRTLETFEMFSAKGGFDIAALAAALGRQLQTQRRALVILNDPAHNPTGYTMTTDEWTAVVDCLVAHSASGPITLVVDCAYMLYGPREPGRLAPVLRPLLGKVAVLFAWSASKSFTHYGLRVGALVACVEREGRAAVESALSYSCRGTWSNCNRGGLSAVTRLLTDSELARSCAAERDALKSSLRDRVERFNRLAHGRRLRYPRYDGGFFVTVFHDDAREKAAAMREAGVFVVPQVLPQGSGALRLALCAVASSDVPRLVDALG